MLYLQRSPAIKSAHIILIGMWLYNDYKRCKDFMKCFTWNDLLAPNSLKKHGTYWIVSVYIKCTISVYTYTCNTHHIILEIITLLITCEHFVR